MRDIEGSLDEEVPDTCAVQMSWKDVAAEEMVLGGEGDLPSG